MFGDLGDGRARFALGLDEVHVHIAELEEAAPGDAHEVGQLPRSDSSKIFAMSGAEPGAIRATIRAWCTVVPPFRCGGAQSASAGAGRCPAAAFSILSRIRAIWTLEFLLMLSVIQSSSTGASGFIAKSCVHTMRVPAGTSS